MEGIMRTKTQKGIIYVILGAVMLLGSVSCKKKTENSSNSTMSATVNGSSQTFSVVLSNSNGATIVQGNSSKYTLTLTLKTLGAGVYNLGDQGTGYYATVTDNLGYSYSTDAANIGQITLTQSGSRYNGTFYFTANETSPNPGGGNISVTSGSCSGI